jgi:hypothetical protein
MTMTQASLSPSSYQAQAILRAWMAGDRGQLNKQLAYASDFPSEISDTAEQERMELLTEIAKQWQMTPGRIPGEHESLYTTLLQHLAQ